MSYAKEKVDPILDNSLDNSFDRISIEEIEEAILDPQPQIPKQP